ncbi:MAG TPA: serine/threonine-protein kinase [Polyangiaceae bacterium]
MSERADGRRVGELVGGKYRIVRLLASGGMGVVYEAQHTVVRRRFAVKFLRAHLIDQRESLTRFQREAQAAGALESENLTAAIDFGIGADGSPFIVMEYLVGESLQALLSREQRLPVGRATDLVSQACRGIHAAHASGIIHRDLKPQNLFVCRREDGTDLLKVLDFGIAKLELVDKGNTATRTGTVLGTPAYMSPEQARGEKDLAHHADVYALGAILYELLSGEKPHPGSSHNAILHHIATQPAVPLDAEKHGLPDPLVEIVMGALAPEASARPESAEALGRALAPFVQREAWPAVKSEDSAPRNEVPESSGVNPVVDAGAGRATNWLAWGAAGVLLGVVVMLASVDRGGPPRQEVVPAAPPAIQAKTPEPDRTVQPAPAEVVPEPPAVAAPLAPAPPSSQRPAFVPSPRPVKRNEPRGTALAESVTQVPLGASRSVPVTFDQSNPYQ